jgi:hypothetical protein
VVVGHVAKVKARLPSVPTFFLLNNKRSFIAELEKEHGVQILILPDGRLRPDEYEFEMEGVRDTKRAAAPSASVEAPKASEARPASSGNGTRGGRKSGDQTSAPREASEA